MSTANAGYNNLSFQGRGTVIGSADSNQTAPPGDTYYKPPRNTVFYTHDHIAYAGATEHTVVCSTRIFKPRQIRNLEISGRGDAYLDIGNWTSPSEHMDDFAPYARAYTDELNPGMHFEPAGGTSVDTDNHDVGYH